MSPAAPKGAIGAAPSQPLARPIWGDNAPAFDDLDQMQSIVAADGSSNAIIAALDTGFNQIEGKQTGICDPVMDYVRRPQMV